MTAGLTLAIEKMRAAGATDTAIAIFADYYAQLVAGTTGIVSEESIAPIGDVARLEDIASSPDDADAFGKTVMIRLNGGLGTSMGLSKAKSLLPVRDGLTFLDLIARQVLAARAHYGVRLPLLFLHSFNTRDDCLAALAAYPDLAVDGLPLDMVQSQEPKLRADDLTPVECRRIRSSSGARPVTATSTRRCSTRACWMRCSRPGSATRTFPTPTTSVPRRVRSWPAGSRAAARRSRRRSPPAPPWTSRAAISRGAARTAS